MYTGHLGIALVARRAAGRRGVLFPLVLIATFGPDWIETIFIGLGASRSTAALFSHSLPAVALGASGMGLLAAGITRSLRGAILVATVFVSHILGDYITGVKPLWPGGPSLGYHLYNCPLLDFAFEAILVAGCLAYYRRSLSPSVKGDQALAVLYVALLLGQALFDWKFAS